MLGIKTFGDYVVITAVHRVSFTALPLPQNRGERCSEGGNQRDGAGECSGRVDQSRGIGGAVDAGQLARRSSDQQSDDDDHSGGEDDGSCSQGMLPSETVR